MSDAKLFRIDGGKATEIEGSAVGLERALQRLIEGNLEDLLGVRFLASEYSTGKTHAGRIDTLGLDENGSPVILEYKRSVNENVINQGLFYLDWLMDHRAEFELAVLRKFGKAAADEIDWSGPRLVCIATDYTKYDEHAVQQIDRNIEFVRYRQFGPDLLLLELVNRVAASAPPPPRGAAGREPPPAPAAVKTVLHKRDELSPELRAISDELRAFPLALGDDVEEKVRLHSIAYRRIKNFASVEFHPTKGCLTAHVKIDPKGLMLEKGFTRDVTGLGHQGVGDLRIEIYDRKQLEKAKPLFVQGYEAS